MKREEIWIKNTADIKDIHDYYRACNKVTLNSFILEICAARKLLKRSRSRFKGRERASDCLVCLWERFSDSGLYRGKFMCALK